MSKMHKSVRRDYGGILFIRNLPAEDKLRFKAYCARMGISMTEGVRILITEAIRRDEKGRLASPIGETPIKKRRRRQQERLQKFRDRMRRKRMQEEGDDD